MARSWDWISSHNYGVPRSNVTDNVEPDGRPDCVPDTPDTCRGHRCADLATDRGAMSTQPVTDLGIALLTFDPHEDLVTFLIRQRTTTNRSLICHTTMLFLPRRSRVDHDIPVPSAAFRHDKPRTRASNPAATIESVILNQPAT